MTEQRIAELERQVAELQRLGYQQAVLMRDMQTQADRMLNLIDNVRRLQEVDRGA